MARAPTTGPCRRSASSPDDERPGAQCASFLVAEHWDELVALAESKSLPSTHSDAEDITGDVITDIMAGHLRPRATNRGQVIAFARACVRNRILSNNRRQLHRQALDAENKAAVENLFDSIPRRRHLLAIDIARALHRLTRREREVACLHWADGCTIRQTAERLRIAPRTAKELARRARRKLMTWLD